MSEDPEWFAPARYGIGMRRPIAWQGWAAIAGYAASTGLTLLIFGLHDPLALAFIVPLTIGLLIICARTTRGGWRWRWGEKE